MIIHGKNNELYSSIFVEIGQQNFPAFDIVRILQHAVSTKVPIDEMVQNEYAAYSLSLCVCVCARGRAPIMYNLRMV